MATYDSSQTLSVLNLNILSTTFITRDALTPPGDPVVVTANQIGVSALSTIVVSNGAKLIINGVTVSALTNIIVSNGGVVELGSGLGVQALSSFTFGSGGGTLQLDPGVNLAVLSNINGFGPGSVIDITGAGAGVSYVASYNPGLLGIGAGTTVAIFSGPNGTGTQIGSVFLSGGDFTSMVNVAPDGSGGTYVGFSCFLAGTLIATPDGWRPVEALSVGDLVTTASGEHRPLAWVGGQTVTDASPDALPVRIRRDAFSDGVPQRDLLVTPEHCIYVEGKLIPARMLVNGGSIIVDETLSSYAFHHLELETHDLIVAEGLMTESYLDTGNRNNFEQGKVHRLFSGPTKSWETHAVAPLTVDRESVEPIWHQLKARAEAQGLMTNLAVAELIADPDLRMITPSGQTLRALRVIDGRHYFLVPPGTESLRLASRTARPADVVGPFLDDRRTLGVLVGEIGIWHGRDRSVIDQHLDAASSLHGWMLSEASAFRWTDGDAELPIDLSAAQEITLVDIHVQAAGPYPVKAAPSRMAVAA